MNNEITARLENWHAYFGQTLAGEIYDDVRNRWEDGTFIHTSYIEDNEYNKAEEGVVIHTMNSVYLLGKKQK